MIEIDRLKSELMRMSMDGHRRDDDFESKRLSLEREFMEA